MVFRRSATWPMAWLIFTLVVCVATAQRWIPLSHERKTPNVDRNVLGNLKETKVLEKMLGLKLLAVEYLFGSALSHELMFWRVVYIVL